MAHLLFSVFVNTTVFVAMVLQFQTGVSLECYSCTNVSALAYCNTIETCPPKSNCYMKLVNGTGIKRYNLGCESEGDCQAGLSTISVVVGRSVETHVPTPCSQCCTVSNCNRQLCQPSEPSCVNNADYNCDDVGSSINICADTRHAQNACRRFCGLCSLANGDWADWSTWSVCDVTCASGTQSRTRSCSNPTPQDGGEDCSGSNFQTQNCSMGACPVNGGWSDWATLGPCSSTCDIGLQRWARTCTQPAPFGGGKQCIGETSQDKLCFPGACSDGAWGNWGPWDSCSRSCGDGLRSRSRACDNPSRSIMGKDCPGDSSKTELCSVAECAVPNIIFLVRTIGSIPDFNVIVFKTIELNEGGGYDNGTGKFTAPVHGAYSFSAQLCPKNRAVMFQLLHNDVTIGGFVRNGVGPGGCASMVSNAILKAGDQVWVQSYYTGDEVYEDVHSIWNMFSGVLVRKLSS